VAEDKGGALRAEKEQLRMQERLRQQKLQQENAARHAAA
jgi:hypothetical protein